MRGQQHVYAIETDDGHIKVGVTFDVKKRLGSLQVGNHRPLTLVFDSQVLDVSVDPLAIEREMHANLARWRARGEWFRVTRDMLFDAVNAVQMSPRIFHQEPRQMPPRRTAPDSGQPKRPRGRPKSITDMRAYKAEKAKAYRARLKLAKPNEDQK